MPDSGKFKDLYLNSAVTYPCQGSPWGCGGGRRRRRRGEYRACSIPAPLPLLQRSLGESDPAGVARFRRNTLDDGLAKAGY